MSFVIRMIETVPIVRWSRTKVESCQTMRSLSRKWVCICWYCIRQQDGKMANGERRLSQKTRSSELLEIRAIEVIDKRQSSEMSSVDSIRPNCRRVSNVPCKVLVWAFLSMAGFSRAKLTEARVNQCKQRRTIQSGSCFGFISFVFTLATRRAKLTRIDRFRRKLHLPANA